MAWNQPNYSKKNKAKPTRRSKRSALIPTISILGVASVLLMARWMMRGDDSDADKVEMERPRLIADAKSSTNEVLEAAEPAKPSKPESDSNARPTKPGQKLNGYVMLPNGELHKIKGEVYSNASREKPKYAVFKYPAENIIAGILAVKPGAAVVGSARDYRGKFIENFNKSLYEPIVVNENDSDYVKEIKQSVAAAKQE